MIIWNHKMLPAWAVLVISLIATFWTWHYSRSVSSEYTWDLMLMTGIILSLVIFAITRSLIVSRINILALSDRYKESEEREKALLGATRESAFLLDSGNRVLAINKIAAERLGTTREDIIGKARPLASLWLQHPCPFPSLTGSMAP